MSDLDLTELGNEEKEHGMSQADSPPILSDKKPSPGEMLKKKREELGYSVDRVAEALYMTARYVRALENDEYSILPGKTFVKGYIKSYAVLVELNVEKVMRCYQEYFEALDENEKSEAKVIRARKSNDQNKRWLFVAAIIIVIVIAVSWWYK